MGFTVSHMAAVLPFYRQRWLSFEALVIGSMLPDLPYFLARQDFVVSHQWLGLFSYCLPWGLAVFVLWCWLLKPACLALLSPWYSCNRDLYPATVTAWLIYGIGVIAGLLIGASTHLIWDGITHADGFIGKQLMWLQQVIVLTDHWQMPLTRFLQYLSSVLGLIYLAIFISDRIRWESKDLSLLRHSYYFNFKKWQVVLILLLMGIGSLFSGLQAMLKWHSLLATDHYLFMAKLLVGLLQGGAATVLLYALIYRIVYTFYP